MSSDRLLCAGEVAQRLGIGYRTLWRRVNTGVLPLPVHRGRGRRALWRESDINAFIAALRPVGRKVVAPRAAEEPAQDSCTLRPARAQ